MQKKTIIKFNILLVFSLICIGSIGVIFHYSNSQQFNLSTKTAINPPGTFSFGIQGDSHPEREGKMFNKELYEITLNNAKNNNVDFYFLMGDDFSIEHLIDKNIVTQSAIDAIYLEQKNYLDHLNVPLYLVNGNHEQEAKYLLDGTDNNPAILARNAREKYFSSPGAETGYYSFDYGNSLFVVIDFYWHTDIPVDNTAGAEKSTDKKNKNLWDITLGNEQYQWFKNTLANSTAKYKFVFSHHVLGTGRGGIENANLYEWGGYNSNGIWQFNEQRPGWEAPIHDLMVKYGVTIFFQGHDHLFAKQELDGIVYQSVPNPADNSYTAFNADAYKSGDILNNSGYLQITVNPQQLQVDYHRSYLPTDENTKRKNDQIDFSYIIK